MRPSGRLHLGHYHGVLKNWIKLQHEYECFFFVGLLVVDNVDWQSVRFWGGFQEGGCELRLRLLVLGRAFGWFEIAQVHRGIGLSARRSGLAF